MHLLPAVAIVLPLACLDPGPMAAASSPQDPPAQSMADLRQEIERLRQQLDAQGSELQAAKARIKELEAALAASKAAAAAAPSGATSPAAPPPPPVPADPTLGPAGMLSAFQAEYLAAFPTMPDTASPQKLNLHLRALEAWCVKMNRDNIRVLTWTGTIDPDSVACSGRNCSFAAVFPSSTRDYRCPMKVDNVMMSGARDPDGNLRPGPLAFQLVVKPKLAVNRQRPQPQAFENPPMVAPYVDCVYEVDVRAIMQPSAAPAAPAAP